jgi:hypothetical protein
LTAGGYNAEEIAIEDIGKRILHPTDEGQELTARREAVLKPRVIREFLQKYDGGSLPRPDIAANVLADMGVPRDRVASVYEMILESAKSVQFLRELKGKQYVALCDAYTRESTAAPVVLGDPPPPPAEECELDATETRSPTVAQGISTPQLRRVFLTHGSNTTFIEPIKRLLAFGEMVPVVSIERQSVSKPVPEKVMDDMRGCGAAIIHVDEEQKLLDRDAKEHVVLNQNVLIEIGAAMALYGRRFILLVKDGLTLPSNLQGLYEVRYAGDQLDGNATIRLLEAINDLKNNPLPERLTNSTHDRADSTGGKS